MAQPSVTNYFNSRKRSALDEHKVIRARKVLILDKESKKDGLKDLKGHISGVDNVCSTDTTLNSPTIFFANDMNKKLHDLEKGPQSTIISKPRCEQNKMPSKHRRLKELPKQSRIKEMFINMSEMQNGGIKETTKIDPEDFESIRHITPPSTPTKSCTIFKNKNPPSELSLQEIRKKLVTSSKLSKLKESIARFNEGSAKLEEQQKKTAALKSPSLKVFKSIDLEVNLSPRKVQSPEKAYLSPKKETSSARRNLLSSLSPTKQSVTCVSPQKSQVFEITGKDSLTLPYKYRFLAEVFRAMDTVSQLLYNRKETITFKRLKPAVEKILKRNFLEKHLAQIKSIYPEAFDFQKNKIRTFGASLNSDHWELTITPVVNGDLMTSDMILERRRKLFSILIEKLKSYHAEFLQTLDPPLNIPHESIKRWHPLFDLEQVPDIESSPLPETHNEEKLMSGQEVLAKAKTLFSCNTRMEKALERLKAAQESTPKVAETDVERNSLLKGIPKALLEKVRKRQAAKALESMTRSDAKDKELSIYTRLPEISRIIRNLFVAEKKNVLPLDTVLLGLDNSLPSFLSRKDLEEHVKLLAREVADWLTVLTIRGATYIKIIKNADMSVVLKKLDNIIKTKSEF